MQAQEAVRMSMAGAAAAQARQDAALNAGFYNLQFGPTYWRFGADLGLAYDDNVTLVQDGRQGDVIFSPAIDTQFRWPISDKQSLNLTIGAGYLAYAEHPKFDRLFISPNSEVSFDIYAGDFLINLHDRFSITENSYLDPTVSGSGGYSQLQNSLGISALWDLNKVVVNLGYDHSDYLELTGGLGQPDRTSEIFSASAGYNLKPGMVLGLELGGGLLHNSFANGNTPYTDAAEWNAGAFFQTQASEHISLTAHAGYTALAPETKGALSTASEFRGFYGALAITHHLNRFVDYSLSGGRSINSSLAGGSVAIYNADLSASWKIFQKVSLTTAFLYQHVSYLVLNGETFEQYGPNISLGRALTKKLSGSLNYQFYARSSGEIGQNYIVDVVSLNLTYQF